MYEVSNIAVLKTIIFISNSELANLKHYANKNNRTSSFNYSFCNFILKLIHVTMLAVVLTSCLKMLLNFLLVQSTLAKQYSQKLHIVIPIFRQHLVLLIKITCLLGNFLRNNFRMKIFMQLIWPSVEL